MISAEEANRRHLGAARGCIIATAITLATLAIIIIGIIIA